MNGSAQHAIATRSSSVLARRIVATASSSAMMVTARPA